MLPDGYAEIIINLYEDRLDVCGEAPNSKFVKSSGSLLYGPRTRPFTINTSRPTTILGIHFRPGGLSPFLNLPVAELHNRIVPLEIIWGHDSRILRERLLQAQTLEPRFQIIERYLITKLHTSFVPHPAVIFTLNQLKFPAPGARIGLIVEQLGISSRHFSHIFGQQVGMTPKMYHRLRRFQTILNHIDCDWITDINWGDLALSYGFFDQAHFIHDFKTFSSLTPNNYYEQLERRPGHVPVGL